MSKADRLTMAEALQDTGASGNWTNAVHRGYYDHKERESSSRTFLVWKVAIFRIYLCFAVPTAGGNHRNAK